MRSLRRLAVRALEVRHNFPYCRSCGIATICWQAAVETAYERTLMPYNGWISQRSFRVAVVSVPGWDAVRSVLAPSEEAFEQVRPGVEVCSMCS